MPSFDSLIRGLEWVAERKVTANNNIASASDNNPSISFKPARAFGDVCSLTQLWNELNFDRLAQTFRSSNRKLDVEAMLKIMVFNRLCDPESRRRVRRWLETVCLPGIDISGITYQHLLRSLEVLLKECDKVDEVVLLHYYAR